jgi:hypothetical protein
LILVDFAIAFINNTNKMAKLNKLLLSKKTEVNSIEYVNLIKLVLSTLIWNNKYQQVILDTIEEGK